MFSLETGVSSDDFEQRCRALLSSLGLCDIEANCVVTRLSGGVSSDIARVSFDQSTVCVKFALAKLKVAEDWYASPRRSQAEYAWLDAAGKVMSKAVPGLFGWSDSEQGFAMEYLAGDDIYLWKSALLAATPDTGEASAVAGILGAIHAASTADAFHREPFNNAEDFESLRIEPYLRYTATVHPGVAERLQALADDLGNASRALIHGDISPKNILIRQGQPVILDAECATMGDPAFDVAFVLNHLVLKAFHLPTQRSNLTQAALQLWTRYKTCICWEEPQALETRVASLLPALMLARVDGKSPVEYLNDTARQRVRQRALDLLKAPVIPLKTLLTDNIMRAS